jgi:mono/diheme cytochrome c family protein
MRWVWVSLAVVAVLIAGLFLRPGAFSAQGVPSTYAALIGSASSEAERGAVVFAYGGWGALSTETLATSGAPWKLIAAAMALQEAGGDPEAAVAVDLGAVYRRFGFLVPQVIANWPETLPAPPTGGILGLNVALAERTLPPVAVTVSNIGCAACHASVTYDATGAPDLTRAWLGMPNGSINLEAWTQALFTAVRDHGGDRERLFAVVEGMFPDTGWREQAMLRHLVWPRLMAVVEERDARFGRLLPFRASLAGATNGLDSLRNRLGLLPEGERVADSIFNSVPDLGGRLWRRMLLNSGSYAVPGQDHGAPMVAGEITAAHREGLAGIIAFFTVPSMGVTPEVAAAHVPDAVLVTAWMEGYRPQPFPGVIDRARLAEGQAVYARDCAACHGSYDASLTAPQLIHFPNWEGDVGTDMARAELLTEEVAAAVNGVFGDHVAARSVAGYAAPPLTGIWASAPYLHNGSVPTLWHLMRPERRPGWFEVGGHRLDLGRVGIDLAPPVGYLPWSQPAEVDIRAFGLGNGGHEVGFEGLTEAEKDALLEYLKLL